MDNRECIEVTLLNGDPVRISKQSVGMARRHSKDLMTEVVTVFGSITCKNSLDDVSMQMGWKEVVHG